MTITLCEGWRLRPLNHLQWVVERQDGQDRHSKLAGERWRIQGFCRTKIGIQTVLSRSGLRADTGVLDGLPEYYEVEAEFA